MTDVKLLLLQYNNRNYLTVCKQMIDSKQNYSCLIKIIETIKQCEKNELRLVQKSYQQHVFTDHISNIYV